MLYPPTHPQLQRSQGGRGCGVPDGEARCVLVVAARSKGPVALGPVIPLIIQSTHAFESAVTARLADAITKPGRVSGRLELLYRGSWTPACSSGFDDRAAIVVCKQVGSLAGGPGQSHLRAHHSSFFPAGVHTAAPGHIWSSCGRRSIRARDRRCPAKEHQLCRHRI